MQLNLMGKVQINGVECKNMINYPFLNERKACYLNNERLQNSEMQRILVSQYVN